MDNADRKEQKTIELSNGEQYSYIEAGDPLNPALLLIHGGASTARSWESVIPDLKKDFRIIAVDLRGHGYSSLKNRVFSMKDYTEDVKLFVDAIGLKKFTFLGWSLGGGLALHFTALYPEYVDKIILHNSMGIKGVVQVKRDETGEPIGRIKTFEEAEQIVASLSDLGKTKNVQDIISFWAIGFYDPTLIKDEILDALTHCISTCRAWADDCFVVNVFNISNEDTEVSKGTNEISKIKCPVLILAGANDLLVAGADLEIKKALGELAELKVYEKTGHNLCIEQKEQFLKDIREFMKCK